MVTRLDRLARSTRDLLNTLAAITAKKAGFRSLGDAWADTTKARGRSRFAADSPLEEAVLSELVSEAKFPASWEYTGYFVRRGPPSGLLAWNPEPNSTIYEPIPYASEQGIYLRLAGN